MANASVVDFDSDLMSLGRGDLDIFDRELLASLPGDGGLASDCLFAKINGQCLFSLETRLAGVKLMEEGR